MSDESKTVPSTSAEPVPSPSTDQGATSPPARPEWWATLESADQKDLAKHPIVSGLVGTLAERQSKKAVERARAEWEAESARKDAERAAQAEEQRLENLRVNQPLDFADEVGRKKATDNIAKMQADKHLSELRQAALEIINDLGLEDSDLEDLKGKQMGATPDEGFRLYVKELNQRALAKHAPAAIEKQMADWKKQMEAAARAAILAEMNGTEPSPDVSAGKPPIAPKGAAALADQKTYESLGKTPQERFAAVLGSR